MRTTISKADALDLVAREESQFWDHKSARSGGVTVQKIASALANADGGEFAVGIEDNGKQTGLDRWQGFPSIEDANHIHQSLVKEIDPPVPYSIDWLEVESEESAGVVALVTIQKSPSVHRTSKGEVYVRRGAQNLKLDEMAVVDLQLSKGTRSYEDQLLERYEISDLEREPELEKLLRGLSPSMTAAEFARKQRLSDKETGRVAVAGAVLFAESPPVVIPKKCSIKIARYETRDRDPRREHLAGTPMTIEGPARVVIKDALKAVTKLIESVSIMHIDGTLAPARYPPEALEEVIVNAVIHRDYNISDDIQVWVFDNRVEVRSPGALPGHMTLKNLLTERFARNPTIVRLLNKYPDPPNKDIGEGLNTVFAKMAEAKLQQPRIAVEGSTFVITLGHTPLARPQELVMDYLDTHDEITNRIGRELTGIASENTMKDVFLALNRAGKLERVPGKGGSKSAWRAVRSGQTSLPVSGDGEASAEDPT